MSDTVPFAAKGIDHLVLRVVDLAVMRDFYRRVLGATDERAQPEIGLFQLRIGAALIDLVPVDGKLGAKGGAAPGREGRNLDHFAIAIDRFDSPAIHAHLARHGVPVFEEGSRYGAEGEGPSVYLSDPEGNIIELKGPPA